MLFRLNRTSCSIAALLVGVLARTSAQSPEAMLEEAFYLEVAIADPEGAIAGYRRVLSLPSSPPRVAAQAHLRLGICYELLGDTQRAREELETVVKEFSREEDSLRLAQRYLGRPAIEDPASFMPPRMLLYLELVDPAEQIRALSDLLRGTPFENPVDYYVSYLARRDADGTSASQAPDAGTRVVSPAAAFLNEGFLHELQKIEGLAVGLPTDRQGNEDFLAILIPGASDILRGIVQMALSLSNSQGTGMVNDVPVFRVPEAAGGEPDGWLHIALGRRFVILGRPRKLVVEAVGRSAGAGSSLAGDADFRRAQAARAGSLVFSYVNSAVLLEELRAQTRGENARILAAMESAFGWEHVHALSLTVSHVEATDSLRVTFRARLDDDDLGTWKVFRTPPLDRDLLRAVPLDCLAFFATRLDAGATRARAIVEGLSRLADEFPEAPGTKEAFQKVRAFLGSAAAAEFLEALDGLVIGQGAASSGSRPTFLVLRFHEPARGAEVTEKVLAAFYSSFLQNAASARFQAEKVPIQGKETTLRFLEPVPGLRIRYLPVGDLVVVSPSLRMLNEAALAHAAGKNAAGMPLSARANKVLWLKNAAILKAPGKEPKIPEGVAKILTLFEHALISTREAKGSFSLDLVVPGITPTARAMLQQFAQLELPAAGGRAR